MEPALQGPGERVARAPGGLAIFLMAEAAEKSRLEMSE
jgi:hypothetical protein